MIIVSAKKKSRFLKKKSLAADSLKNVLVEYDPSTNVLSVASAEGSGAIIFRKVVKHAVALRPKLNRRSFRFDAKDTTFHIKSKKCRLFKRPW